MPHRRLTREENRQRILQKAGELFRQYGFGKTTVADIAGELGMSTANIYKFFPSRNAIVEASAEQNVATIKRNVTKIVEGSGTCMERLEASIFSVYRFHKELLQNERQIFKLISSAIEEDWSCIQEFDIFMRGTFERLVVEGIESKEFRPADSSVTASALLDCLSLALHPHIRNAVVHDGSEERVHAQLALLAKALR